MVPQGRDGAEKGRALEERTEERKEKGEERERAGRSIVINLGSRDEREEARHGGRRLMQICFLWIAVLPGAGAEKQTEP